MLNKNQAIVPDVTPSGTVLPASRWEKLRFEQQLEAHNSQYELQILTFCRRRQAGLNHDHGHAWIRLVKPNGSYSSLGFYPDESMGIEPEKQPGLRFPGVLLQPDKYDQIKKNILQTCIPLSERRFKELTQLIELKQQQAQTTGLNFDLVESNCVEFIESSCRSVGISVESRCRFLSFFCCFSVSQYIVPAPLGAWFFNLSLLFLGGLSHKPHRWIYHSKGKTALSEQIDISPLFSSVHRALLGQAKLFYHVKSLQAWQRQFDQSN